MNYLYGIRMSGDIIMDDKVNPSRTLNWKSFGPEKWSLVVGRTRDDFDVRKSPHCNDICTSQIG